MHHPWVCPQASHESIMSSSFARAGVGKDRPSCSPHFLTVRTSIIHSVLLLWLAHCKQYLLQVSELSTLLFSPLPLLSLLLFVGAIDTICWHEVKWHEVVLFWPGTEISTRKNILNLGLVPEDWKKLLEFFCWTLWCLLWALNIERDYPTLS